MTVKIMLVDANLPLGCITFLKNCTQKFWGKPKFNICVHTCEYMLQAVAIYNSYEKKQTAALFSLLMLGLQAYKAQI